MFIDSDSTLSAEIVQTLDWRPLTIPDSIHRLLRPINSTPSLAMEIATDHSKQSFYETLMKHPSLNSKELLDWQDTAKGTLATVNELLADVFRYLNRDTLRRMLLIHPLFVNTALDVAWETPQSLLDVFILLPPHLCFIERPNRSFSSLAFLDGPFNQADWHELERHTRRVRTLTPQAFASIAVSTESIKVLKNWRDDKPIFPSLTSVCADLVERQDAKLLPLFFGPKLTHLSIDVQPRIHQELDALTIESEDLAAIFDKLAKLNVTLQTCIVDGPYLPLSKNLLACICHEDLQTFSWGSGPSSVLSSTREAQCKALANALAKTTVRYFRCTTTLKSIDSRLMPEEFRGEGFSNLVGADIDHHLASICITPSNTHSLTTLSLSLPSLSSVAASEAQLLFKHVARLCTNLESFSLSTSPFIPNPAITPPALPLEILFGLARLTVLKIDDDCNVFLPPADGLLEAVAVAFPQLRTLEWNCDPRNYASRNMEWPSIVALKFLSGLSKLHIPIDVSLRPSVAFATPITRWRNASRVVVDVVGVSQTSDAFNEDCQHTVRRLQEYGPQGLSRIADWLSRHSRPSIRRYNFRRRRDDAQELWDTILQAIDMEARGQTYMYPQGQGPRSRRR